jgi:hypothetical protein
MEEGSKLKKLTDMFNALINSYGLREIKMARAQFAWPGNQEKPTMEKLDIILEVENVSFFG